MNPEILAGQQSYYNTKSVIRYLATDNMVSHGGLTDIRDEAKIVIGKARFFKWLL